MGTDNKVLLKQINIVRDLGKELEISGLQAEDRVIDNPPDGVSNGETVRVKPPEKTSQAPSPAKS